MTEFYLALGANLPDAEKERIETLNNAIRALETLGPVRRSDWYTTPAFPPGEAPDFVNGAAILESDLEPEALLERMHAIEAELGRTRDRRWEARFCDIDMIAAGDRILPDRDTLAEWIALDLGKAQTLVPPRLVLPHPRVHERSFVLVPLCDLAPDWVHPYLGRTARQLRDALPPEDLAQVVRIEGSDA